MLLGIKCLKYLNNITRVIMAMFCKMDKCKGTGMCNHEKTMLVVVVVLLVLVGYYMFA
jgi:hypothetical protein